MLAALGLACNADAQEVAPSPPPVPAPPAPAPANSSKAETASDRRERALQDAEQALRKSMMPRPIERARFMSLLAAIDPALAQRQDLVDAHASYSDGLERQNESTSRQILRLLPAAFSYDAARESFEPRATPELVALLGLRDKAQRNVAIAERKLLDAVEAATPGERKARLARALLDLRIEQAPKSAVLPSTRVTLFDVLAKIAISAEKRASLDDSLTAYATALAKSLSERTALLRTGESTRAITEVAAGTLWRYAPAEITSAVEKQLAELEDREFASELTLRTVHFDALARIRPRLDPKDGRRLVELWQQMLHPSLFDDERLLGRVVEQSIAHPAFTADADTALLDVLETSYQRLEPLSRRLCEDADLILPRLAVATTEAMHADIDARLALIKTQHRRREIIKEALQRVRGMLGDADAEMTARVEDAIASVDSLDRADSFEEKALAARAQSLADAPAPGASRPTDESAKPADTPKSGAGAGNGAPAAGGAGKDAARDADQAPRNGRGSRGSRRNNDN